jgi:hypothetical protein
MADENFDAILLRWIASELYFSLEMQTAREMFGKRFFSLGEGERIAVNAVGASVRGNYQAMTLDYLAAQEAPPKNPAGKPLVGSIFQIRRHEHSLPSAENWGTLVAYFFNLSCRRMSSLHSF